jgi:hypothetical protein
MLDGFEVAEENWRDALEKVPHFCISESPTFVGRGIAALAADPDQAQYAGKSLTSFDLATAYGLTDSDGSRPNCWSYIVEVEQAGQPANADGYR